MGTFFRNKLKQITTCLQSLEGSLSLSCLTVPQPFGRLARFSRTTTMKFPALPQLASLPPARSLILLGPWSTRSVGLWLAPCIGASDPFSAETPTPPLTRLSSPVSRFPLVPTPTRRTCSLSSLWLKQLLRLPTS